MEGGVWDMEVQSLAWVMWKETKKTVADHIWDSQENQTNLAGGEVQSRPEQVSLHVVCRIRCCSVLWIPKVQVLWGAAGQVQWKDTNTDLAISSVASHWGLGEYPGEDFLYVFIGVCFLLGEGMSPWWTKGSEWILSYALMLCSWQHRFQPQNPLSGAQQFVAKDPQEDDDLKLCSHTMMLPTRGQLEGRMIVTAYEHGLDNVTEEAVTAVVYAVEVRLGWVAAVVSWRQQQKALCASLGRCPSAWGGNLLLWLFSSCSFAPE